MITYLLSWRKRRDCFHHNSDNGESYIGRGKLIDLGRRKLFRCSRCEQVWMI